jgi:tRNA-specific 2-thiouridylase
MKAAIAMSGGVDSSVAAALLLQSGHDIFGVTMRLAPGEDAIESAREAAARLGIPHHVIELRDIFERRVIAPFCREYARGRTPNPCVVCNREIKFGALREKVMEMGAEIIATGHHARVEGGLLKKGADARKDQSYFLCSLSSNQLARAIFPVGGLTKSEVRRLAAGLGLPNASRPESQEICFVPGGNYAAFVGDHLRQTGLPGPILDEEGRTLGEHRGIASYTVGQRHGLGIAAAEPLYVTAIRPDRNAVVVGTKKSTLSKGLIGGDLNWLAGPPPRRPLECRARVRYRHPEAPATVTPLDDNTVYVKFAEPQMAVTPGQTVAFYAGDTVLGGATILRQEREP